jgi:hypothetical protein
METVAMAIEIGDVCRSDHFRGIALVVIGWAERWTDGEWIDCSTDEDPDDGFWTEPEPWTDETVAVVRMIGDDTKYDVDVADMEVIDDEVCSCGQLGCSWAGV